MREELVKLNEIAQRYNENLFSKATHDELIKYEEWLPNICRERLKKETRDLFEIANGFEFNGLIVYSINEKRSNNIYDLNDEWHDNEELGRFIFFADSDITWYCYGIEESCYLELDKPSGSIISKYEHFDELIALAIDSIT